MKNKILFYLVSVLHIFTPIALIQLYLFKAYWFPILLILSIVITVFYLCIFIRGLNKRIKSYILSFPIYIISFFCFFKVVQFQDERNFTTANKLIALIEEYKKSNLKYPNALAELEGKYMSNTPKIWRGLMASEYLYYYDKSNQSFSLTMKLGENGGKTWQSSIGSWDYFGD